MIRDTPSYGIYFCLYERGKEALEPGSRQHGCRNPLTLFAAGARPAACDGRASTACQHAQHAALPDIGRLAGCASPFQRCRSHAAGLRGRREGLGRGVQAGRRAC